MKTILGIDPGTKGAIACLSMDGSIIDILDMPIINKNKVHGAKILSWIADLCILGHYIDTAFLEKMTIWTNALTGKNEESEPKTIKRSAKTESIIMQQFGALQTVLGIAAITIVEIHATKWQTMLPKILVKRDREIYCVNCLWPREMERFTGARGGRLSGRMDAALIGEFGRRSMPIKFNVPIS